MIIDIENYSLWNLLNMTFISICDHHIFYMWENKINDLSLNCKLILLIKIEDKEKLYIYIIFDIILIFLYNNLSFLTILTTF